MKFLTVIFALAFSFSVMAEPIELPVNDLPYTKHQLKVDTDNTKQYVELAKNIGLEYHKVYGYREFYDAKRANNIGIAGQYDFLLLSTGGNSWNAEDDARAQKSPLHWEATYFGNHDMTIIIAVKNEGERSYVKLVKLAKGRVPDLHLK